MAYGGSRHFFQHPPGPDKSQREAAAIKIAGKVANVRILIVEDEFLIAMETEEIVAALGHDVVGPVATSAEARQVAPGCDFAFVDVRLADGETGPALADDLFTKHGITVVFTTGNPDLVMASRSAVGVLPKPFDQEDISSAITYAVARRNGENPEPTRRLQPIFADQVRAHSWPAPSDANS